MTRNAKPWILIGLLATMGQLAWAQSSPVGVWKSIDEKTQAPKAQVRISDQGGVLVGHVEKILATDTAADAVCDQCTDDRKGQRIQGLEIIRGVKKVDDNAWDGGTILDAKEGKVYKVSLKPIEGGKKLEVHGYIGFALIGRTQTWVRVE